ncbi:hypothetical protein HPB47_009414 [Ixodes persulcatus]|uniref:Uncharacterized protein n=1 Tax=Ixodes persulcatus TaxID=34615 RepID=A0AC60P211_IXOPE|nr:hypothetical protein HPB47_009414 [Ixodes persulcatus]
MTSSSSSSSGLTAFPPPAVFLAVPGPPIVAWPAWKRAFLTFLDASALHLVEPFRKKAILFSLLGTEGQRIVDAFQLYETVAVEGTDEFQVFLEAECEGSELPTLSRAIQIARQYEQRAKTAASFRRREAQVPVAAEVQRVQGGYVALFGLPGDLEEGSDVND